MELSDAYKNHDEIQLICPNNCKAYKGTNSEIAKDIIDNCGFQGL